MILVRRWPGYGPTRPAELLRQIGPPPGATQQICAHAPPLSPQSPPHPDRGLDPQVPNAAYPHAIYPPGRPYRLRREHVFHQVLVRNLLPDQSNRFLPIQCLSHSPSPLTCRSTSTVSCPAFSTSDSLTSLWVTKRTTFSPSDTAKTPRFFNSSTTREAVTPNPSKFTTMMFVSTGCGIDTPSTSPKYPASRAAFLWSSANLSMLFSSA